MTDLVIGVIVLALVGGALRYVVKARKRGVKCMGCPTGSCGSSSAEDGCGCAGKKKSF